MQGKRGKSCLLTLIAMYKVNIFSRYVLASLLVMSGPNSGRRAGEPWPALASFPDPKIPIRACLILSTSKHRFACSLIYGDRYFVYGQIYPSYLVRSISTCSMSYYRRQAVAYHDRHIRTTTVEIPPTSGGNFLWQRNRQKIARVPIFT